MSLNSMTGQLKQNIRLTVIAGAAATITFNLTNPFLSLFVIRLGGTDYHIAWLSALPALAAMLVLIPGGAFVDRFPYKKNITCILIGTSKFFYLCLALAPFLPVTWQATIVVVIIGLMRFPGSLSEIAWQSFFADYIPEIDRGNALAQKQRISTIFGITTTFIAGYVLSKFPANDLDRIRFYQAFFVFAFLIACVEVYANMRIKEPHFEENETTTKALHQTPLLKRFKLIITSFRDTPQAKRFLIFATCSIIFHFGWQMGWPLFGIYQIKYLNASEDWLAIISVVSGITSVLSYTKWSRFAQKYGNDVTLVLTGFGMAMTPILYAVSKSLPVLAAMNAIVGISTSGFILTLMNMTLIEVPKFQRTLYIACYNTFINVSAIFAPNVGVFINTILGIRGALYAAAFFRFLGVVSFFIRYHYYAKENKNRKLPYTT